MVRRVSSCSVGTVMVVLAVLSIGGCYREAPERSAGDVPARKAVPGELVVRFTPEAASSAARHRQAAERVVQTGIPSIDRLHRRFGVYRVRPPITAPEDTARARRLGLLREYVYFFPDSVPVAEVAQAYRTLEEVETARPNRLLRPLNVGVGRAEEGSWALEAIEARAAWTKSRGDSTTVIAVLDPGSDWKGAVGRWHGTVMASVAAGVGEGLPGVCPDCSILPLRVGFAGEPGRDPSRETRPVVHVGSVGLQRALVRATDQEVDVITIGLGVGVPTPELALGISYAYGGGVLVVAAAGNQGEPTLLYPAAYPHTVAVGAVTSEGTRASFSNYGEGLDLVAPGADVPIDVPPKGRGPYSGTSIAAAQVSGVVGLIRSVNPLLGPGAVRLVLHLSAGRLPVPRKRSFDRLPVMRRHSLEFGYGQVNAARATELARRWKRSGAPF